MKIFEKARSHRYISGALSALCFFAALVIPDAALRALCSGEVSALLPPEAPLYFSLFCALLLTGVSLLLPRAAAGIFNIAAAAFTCLIALVHAFFYSFFGTYMSFSSVMFAGDGAGFFSFSYFDISKRFVAFLLLSVLLSVLSFLLRPKLRYRPVRIGAGVLAFALGLAGQFFLDGRYFSDEGGITWNSVRTPAEIYDEFDDLYACMHMVGLYRYTARDFAVSTGLSEILDAVGNSGTREALDRFYSEREPDGENAMSGEFEGKNLILIQLEAIDSWMLNDIAMPNLAAIRENSIDFTNYYAPKYLWAATFNTENLVNTGLVSPTNSSKTSYFDTVSYPYSMARLFSEKGYRAESFHRSSGTIYNREKVHLNWGYSAYNSGGSLGLSDLDLDSAMMEAYEKIVSDEPFFSFIITYSGHGPYSRDDKESHKYYDELKAKLPDDAEEEYICALCHAKETDVFIGELFERLKSDGRLGDTVLIFYTDHYDHYISDSALLAKYKGTSDTNMMCRLPFFIYSEGGEPERVEKVVASYDILPTVANLFSLGTDGRYYFGSDAFSDGGGYVVFQDKSWYDGETYFRAYSSASDDAAAARNQEIADRFNASWNTVKSDYFRARGK